MASVSNYTTLPSSSITIMLMVLSAWDYRYFMPAFEVTVDQVNQRFGDQFQLQLLPLMQPETNDCSRATADMSNLISKYYYENKSTTALSFVAVSTCKVIFIIITSLRFIVTNSNGPSKISPNRYFCFFCFFQCAQKPCNKLHHCFPVR